VWVEDLDARGKCDDPGRIPQAGMSVPRKAVTRRRFDGEPFVVVSHGVAGRSWTTW
jgi:hypothetical protein